MEADDGGQAMPERIARYELLIPIGTGGMGTVYLGHNEVMPGVQREVAVKLMHPQLRAEEGVADQLLQEAKLAASIRHPNVVQVLEAGHSAHGVFIALDFVDGDTLSGILRATLKRGRQVPFPIAARILYDALTGLHAAHELAGEDGRPLDLVHRDFSPQNILVGVDGIARLTDFGIAKALGNVNATATGVVKGKVGYMSPEQARGERLERRADVWAAGVVAWELIAGKRLFRGANEAATLLQVVSGKPPPLVSSERQDASPALDAAIAAALESDAQQRLATAQALRDRLTEALIPLGGLADPDDVGAFVKEAVGDRIEKRRLQAADVKRLRHEIADLSASAGQAAKDSIISSMSAATSIETPAAGVRRTGSRPPPEAPPPEAPPPEGGRPGSFEDAGTQAALSAERQEASVSGRRRGWIALGAAAAVVVGGVAAWRFQAVTETTASPAAAETSTANPSPASAATSEATAEASATVTADLSEVQAPRMLSVRADRPIAQLRIGDRNIVLPEPGRAVEVPLREGDVRLVSAIADDGRKVEAELRAGQAEVSLVFPAKKATPVARPRPAAPRPRPSPPPSGAEDGPGLADSPY